MSIIGVKMTEYMRKMRDHNYLQLLDEMNLLEYSGHKETDKTTHTDALRNAEKKVGQLVNGVINTIRHDLMADYSMYKTTFEEPLKFQKTEHYDDNDGTWANSGLQPIKADIRKLLESHVPNIDDMCYQTHLLSDITTSYMIDSVHAACDVWSFNNILAKAA